MGILSVFNKLAKLPTKFMLICVIIGMALHEEVEATQTNPKSKDDTTNNNAVVENILYCDENLVNNRNSKRLLFVTLLDGTLSTLDMTKNGTLEWTIQTEPGFLLSSSIHNLDLTNNGKMVKMIPSLSGNIYKFDGDSVEAIPITAEQILKASFKFSDDLVFSGGKETRSYGVNSRTGSIVYECSINGCKNRTSFNNGNDILEDEKTLLDDTVVIRRHTQTVRAIEPRTGIERWNFSIGHHELELLKNEDCRIESTDQARLDELIFDIDLRVIVPEGIICAFSKSDPTNLLWKYEFEHPIVSVHRSDPNDKLFSVDLFSNTQWLWNNNQDHYIKTSGNIDTVPSLYLGMYNQQLYIQESQTMRANFEMHTKLQKDLIADGKESAIIPFKPFQISKTALSVYEKTGSDGPSERINNEVVKFDDITTKLSILYSSKYVDFHGFYLFAGNSSTICDKKKATRSTVENTIKNKTFPNDLGIAVNSSSLWDYWKEVVVIALTTAIIVNVMLNNRSLNEREVVFVERHIEVPVPIAKEAIEFEEEQQEQQLEIERGISKLRSYSESNNTTNGSGDQFTSRFLTDFDMVQCLGKGGFGVVFEAKNKLDDCNYAIKRIVLPTKQESRERVMREVKTLANCEHKNIVRYFQAWVEQPPKGWQEEKDVTWLKQDYLSTSITIDSPSPTDEQKPFSISNEMQSNKQLKKKINTNKCMRRQSSLTKGTVPSTVLDDIYFNNNIDYVNSMLNECPNTITDDSISFIEFKHDTSTSDIFRNIPEISISESEQPQIESSFDISFRNPDGNNDHIVSVNHTDSNTEDGDETDGKLLISLNQRKIFKKVHRRSLSLDLLTCNDILSKSSTSKKKPLTLNVNQSNRMYLYIQMQLCMKQSLKDWLRDNSLEMRNGKTFDIFDQIVSAVHYVHLKGMIHRDLKPSNIFFSLDGQIKIGDFGLVTDMRDMPVDPLESSSSSGNMSVQNSPDFTVVGDQKHTQQVGTQLYMSPEQAKGLPYNYKVDIYSLGLILFELLVYFGTESERFKILEGLRKHEFPNEFQQNFINEFQLLKMMLAKQPEERPTTFGILARPPLKREDIQVSSEWHFELPTRRRDSNHMSINIMG